MRRIRSPRNASRPPAPRKALVGLQAVDVFKGLDARVLREIADRCSWKRYQPNQYVIQRDGTDRDVYIVIAGMVRVAAQAESGRRMVFRDFAAGELFGEHSAIDGRPRFADVLAVRESLLASMSPEAFRAILANYASVRERVMRRLSGTVRELAGRLLDLGARRVQWRVRIELLRLARRAGVSGNVARIENRPRNNVIASSVGTSREEVSRELSFLARKGLLERTRRALTLRDVAALEQLVASAPPEEPWTEETGPDESGERYGASFERQWRAVLVAHAFDAVRMMERDELRTVERWQSFFTHAAAQTIPTHGGRGMEKFPDGGMLAEFPDARQALRCAFELHRALARLDGTSAAAPLRMRVGIHVAEVIVEAFNVLGDGVNVAAGLAELANPGETIVSAPVRDQLSRGVDAALEDLGEQRLRNRERTVRAFRAWPAVDRARSAPSAALAAHGRPSIAVIPFQVRSDDPRFAFAGDGLADETIAALSRVADFFVVSRLSSMAFCRAPLGVRGVGEALGVRYVLSGSIQTAPAGALLIAELADTRDGRILWSERLRCDLPDVFAMQAELARGVVRSVAPFVRGYELRRARITNFDQLDAYAITLRGVDLMHRLAREDFQRARNAFETALERDPVFAAPHAWLGKWHLMRLALGASDDPPADGAAASACAARALDCDPDDALALGVDAMAAAWSRHDLDTAERRLSQALEANPNEPLAWLWTAMAHAWRGRGSEAVQAAERALSLSPLDPMLYYFKSLASTAHVVGERYERAVELAESSLRENCLHTPTLRTLAVALALSGRMDEARLAVERLHSLEPQLTVRAFKSRYPGRDSPQASRFAEALEAAGLPP